MGPTTDEAIVNDPKPVSADVYRMLAGERHDILLVRRRSDKNAVHLIKFPPARPIPMPSLVEEVADLGDLGEQIPLGRNMMVFDGDMIVKVELVSFHCTTPVLERVDIELYVEGCKSIVPVDSMDTRKIRQAIVEHKLDLPAAITDGEEKPAHVARVMHMLRRYGTAPLRRWVRGVF